MKTLDEIMIATESDKATAFTRTWAKPHGYAPIYDRFFTPMRDKPIKLLEIGVGGGESIRGWLEYFTDADVFGVDIVKDTNPWNTVGYQLPDRYAFVHGDQSLPEFWKRFIANHGGQWDIVIDDGSHIDEHISLTFSKLWPYMKAGGLYCIEDMGSMMHPMAMFDIMISGMHKGYADVSEIHFSKELAILRKQA